MANFPTHQVFTKFSFLKKFFLEPLPCSIWTDCPLGLACTVSLCFLSPSSGAPLLLCCTGLPFLGYSIVLVEHILIWLPQKWYVEG